MESRKRARLFAHMLALLAASAIGAGIAVGAEQPATPTPLSLTDVLSRAIQFDPALDAGLARIDAAEANARQAGVKPNPMIGVDVENFGGTGNVGLADRTEATFFYEQSFERGGKREARVGAARAEIDLTRARILVRRLDLIEQVQVAWVEAQSAEAMVALAERRLAVAIGLEQDVSRRVAAARDPVFTGERARTAVAQARLDLDRARENARQARQRLAAYWGGGTADYALDTSDYLKPVINPARPLDESIPDLALLIAERDLAEARIGVERSKAVTDPRFRGGVRYLADGNGVALVLGGSIPLQRYDTNQGAIDRAQAERLAAEKDIDAWRIEREREIARLISRRSSAIREIGRIDRDVLPGARRAADLARDGFNRGGGAFTYLDIAEAERAILDAEARRIELFKSFHLDTVRLDRLLAVHAPLISNLETR
jgi:cobalt-zinc-cadmium efflux system outer membrane protein